MTVQRPEPQRSSIFSQLTVALILLAHTPTVLTYLFGQQGLWGREHYQFFPFAFATFGWLLWTRRAPGVFYWDWLSWLLVIADIACICATRVLANDSPLVWYVGLLFSLTALCRACRDREYKCSLVYLMLLPLIVLRPPLAYDETMIHWLQRVTTGVASNILNFSGYLHLRAGNVLEFPGRQFLVEEACSGVQSLFTLLFLAAVVICGYRRRWLPAILVLLSAGCLAGVLNVIRVCCVAIAWEQFDVDLSSGWQHDTLGYVALVIAALLVLSADALFAFLMGRVPDDRGGGVTRMYYNPLTTVWNWVLRRKRRIDGRIEPNETHEIPRDKVACCAAALFCAAAIALQLSHFLN